MIDLEQFFVQWNGRYNNYDGQFGTQCTDLMRQKIWSVDGYSPYVAVPQTGNAIEIFNKFTSNKYYEKIINTPNAIPSKGDMMFYKYFPFLYGVKGHVNICDEADLYYVLAFGQNYPNGKPCLFTKQGKSKLLHGYRGCVGWLHKK